MDVSDYLPMFLAEAREHVQDLNLAVVKIEEDPADRETVDEIFRAAHSLKGMAATMGFTALAELTHEMESVFELLRQRRGGLERASIDVLLECLDALTAAVDAIDEDGEERLEHAPLVERLRELIRDHDAAAEVEAQPLEAIADPVVPEGPVVHVTATLVTDALMPSVRAYQVLAALAEHGRVLRSVPGETQLEGFDGRTIEVWIETEHEAVAVAAAAQHVTDVAVAVAYDELTDGEEALAVEPSSIVAPAKKLHSHATSTVRVDSERLDQLMHLMGELVVHRTHVESLALHAGSPDLVTAVQDLTRSSQALQAMVMQVRMIPVEAVFLRFPRLVRDLSTKLGKQVELVLAGQETELDRTVVDALGDPIVHLVRNAIDHGIESAAERAAAGKPASARLEIAARHAGGNVVITVSDDGRGIDPGAVARKAAQRGLIPADAVDAIDLRGAIELLFTPGFSTADVTTDISGRGVGLDAVRATIRGLGGEVLVQSQHGSGTTAQVRLPLTLAIMSTLLVEAGGLPFAIPIDRVERTLRLADHTVRSVAGSPMLIERDDVLPLIDAATALGQPGGAEPTHAVVVRGAEQRLALAVTELIGQRELVTRSLPASIAHGAAVSGGAVLSNGSIALIVDCDAVAEALAGRAAGRLATAA